jgi:hypothetical protein
MRIHVAHRFSVTPRAYWEATRNPALEARMTEAGEVDFHSLEHRVEGSVTHDRIRVVPRKELPAVAQKALGTPRFTYVQIVDSDDDAMTTCWKVVTDVLSEKVTCAGTSRVVPAPEGCERVIEGEIKVAIPLVGGAIEKVVLEQLAKSYDRAADVIRDWFARS